MSYWIIEIQNFENQIIVNFPCPRNSQVLKAKMIDVFFDDLF